MLRLRWNNASIRLYQRCFKFRHRRCVNVVQHWKSYVEFCFIFNAGSTLFQRWSTLKQRWSDVETMAGILNLWRRKWFVLNLLFTIQSEFVSMFIGHQDIITRSLSSESLRKPLVKPANLMKTKRYLDGWFYWC